MRAVIHLFFLIVMLFGASGADAKASAEVTIAGRTLSTSGGAEDIFFLVPFTVDGGQTLDFFYDYSIRLMDDGLPAEMSEPFCTGTFPASCRPDPTGFELTYAKLVVGFRDGRAANPFVDVVGDGVTLRTTGDSFADAVAQSGVLHVHVTGHPVFPERDNFLVYAFAVVDSNPASPIPEPDTYLMFGAGLAVMALARRRMTGSRSMPRAG